MPARQHKHASASHVILLEMFSAVRCCCLLCLYLKALPEVTVPRSSHYPPHINSVAPIKVRFDVPKEEEGELVCLVQ